MKNRYLCKKHFYQLCQNFSKAQQFWDRSMAMGLDAINAENHQKAERCFGTAYDIANITLDRQVSSSDNTDIAANTLLAAQYLATSLVQQREHHQAEEILQQLHEKFNFICRNPSANQDLRETLCNCLIPYIEKLYCIALGPQNTAQPAQVASNEELAEVKHLINSPKSSLYHNRSTLYH